MKLFVDWKNGKLGILEIEFEVKISCLEMKIEGELSLLDFE